MEFIVHSLVAIRIIIIVIMSIPLGTYFLEHADVLMLPGAGLYNYHFYI